MRFVKDGIIGQSFSLLGWWWLGAQGVGRVCCIVRTLVRKYKTGVVGIISLNLNLAVDVLLFSEIICRRDFSAYFGSRSGLCRL